MSNKSKAGQSKQWRISIATVFLAVLCFTPLGANGAGSADAKMPSAKIGSNLITLEIAASDAEIEHGLMDRTSLPEDQGMVFLFHPPRPVNFWMFHTLIPLDMLFVKDGKIVKIFHDVPPCKSEDPRQCPTYPEGKGMTVSEVIEVNGGYAKRHNVREGEHVDLELR